MDNRADSLFDFDPLPARLATRITALMAVVLTALVTITEATRSASVLALYWLLSGVLVVLAVHPRATERFLTVYITFSWLVSGLGALVDVGFGDAAPILLTSVALAGLLVGPRSALALTLLVVLAMVVTALSAPVAPRVTPASSSERWASSIATFGAIATMTALVQTATLRKAAHATARARRFALVIERTRAAVVVTRADRRVEWVNEAFTRLTGYEQAQVEGGKLGALLQGPATDPREVERLRACLAHGEAVSAELVNYTRSGEPYWVSLDIQPFFGDQGELLGFTGSQVDVTARRLRAELDGAERTLGLGLSDAQSERDVARVLVQALGSCSAVLAARVVRAADGAVLHQMLTSARTVDVAALERSLQATASSAPAVGAVATEARDEGGVPHVSLTTSLCPAPALALHVVVALDVPGRAELTARLPGLASVVRQLLLRLTERARFVALFERSPDALLLVDDAGRVVERNAVACTLWPTLAPGGALAAIAPAMSGALAALEHEGSNSSATLAWQLERADGPPLDLESSFARVTLETGPGLLVATRDTSARRRAEHALEAALEEVRRALGEREVLLREIHHRVKNNLQVVSSLLSMQGDRSPEARVALEDSVHRIRSMSLIHEMLYGGSDLSRVDLAAYARALATDLCEALDRDAQLDLRLEPAEVSVEAAIPCGLVLNELITNALKHGRSADGRCRLQVDLHRFEGRIRVCVSDQGPGLPGVVGGGDSTALGMRIIRALAGQLSGSLAFGPGPGAAVELSFPA
jgi:PAS domain S-box-containing protein